MVQFPPFASGEVAVRGGEVVALLVQFPLIGGGEVAVQDGEVTVQDGEAPKPQTTSVNNIDDGALWLRWSALWAQRRLAWCVARKRTR